MSWWVEWLLCPLGGFLLVGKPKKTKSLSQTNVRGRRTGAGGQLLAGITCAEYCKIRKKEEREWGRGKERRREERKLL